MGPISKTALSRGVWSAGLFLCGWAAHEQYLTGKGIGMMLAGAVLIWLMANIPAER